MIRTIAVAFFSLGLTTHSVLACNEPYTNLTTINETTTMACDKAWMDLQRRIKIARGFTGPNDYENSSVVIEAERMLAALNTFDGAAADLNVDTTLIVGRTLANDESLRNVVRAALLHVAFGKLAMNAYCEHLVTHAASPDTGRLTETFEMRQIREALQCGTK